MVKILITQARWDSERFFKKSLSLLENYAEVITNKKDTPMTPVEIVSECNKNGIDIIITGWGGCNISPEIIRASNTLKMIAVLGGTIKGHSPQLAFDKGIRFCNCPRAIGKYVAEFTLGLILAMCYEIPYHDFLIKKQKTHKLPEGEYYAKNGYLSTGLSGSKVGIIGSGNIAKYLINLLKPFNCSIMVYDPFFTDRDANTLNVQKNTLEELMINSEIVAIHAALTPATTGMISEKHLALLRDGAIIVNTARMPIIDEKALLEEIKNGRLKGCFNLIPFNEIWYDKEIENNRNIYLSGGSASVTDKTLQDMGTMLSEDIIRFINREKIINEVDKEMLQRMT